MIQLLNFKAQFADAVETGKKRQTLRPERNRDIRVGDTLRLYTGLRQKGARLLSETKCKSVMPLEIGLDFLVWITGGVRIFEPSFRRMEAIAKEDGFPHWPELWEFFDKTYPPGSKNRTKDDCGILLDLIKW